jgi:hypothetical protein
MCFAKITALVGMLLLVGGTTGSLAPASQAFGAFLVLVAATIGAVVSESRDLELVAGLVAHPADDRDTTVIEPALLTATQDEPIQLAA